MSYQVGDKIMGLNLPNINGSQFTLDQVQGKRYMLSFMRFAACPFCQLRKYQLISNYQEFAVKQSVAGLFKAMFFRMPTLLTAMFAKGYFPSSIKGKLTTLPADILVNEQGIIEFIYIAKDSGDHLLFDRVKALAAFQKN